MSDAEFIDFYFKLHLAIGAFGAAVGLLMIGQGVSEYVALKRYLNSINKTEAD